MPELLSCPPTADLQDLLSGGLSVNAAERLEQHVTACDRCGSTLETLLSRDRLRGTLREAAAGSSADSAVSGLIHRLLERSPGPTLTGEMDATPAPESEAAATEMLAPPENPDELGRLG